MNVDNRIDRYRYILIIFGKYYPSQARNTRILIILTKPRVRAHVYWSSQIGITDLIPIIKIRKLIEESWMKIIYPSLRDSCRILIFAIFEGPFTKFLLHTSFTYIVTQRRLKYALINNYKAIYSFIWFFIGILYTITR